MKKYLITNVLISITAVFFVLFCAEIIMRLSWKMGGWVNRPFYRRNFNPFLRYELIPGAKYANVSINSDGFRGPEYSIPKPANTFRIIMLGDSETLCFSLIQSDTLTVQLENLLNQKPGSVHYEILNFGVEGYNIFQEMEMLKTKGLKYNPDLIILDYVLNDPEPGEYYFEKTFLIRHSALMRYFSYRIKKSLIRKERRRLNIKTEVDNYYYYHSPKYLIPVKETMLEMADIAARRANKLVVVIFSCSSIEVKDFKENYPYRKLHELIKNINADNIIFVDLIDEFNRLNMTPQSVSIDYKIGESHKNAPALKISAQYIYGILKSNRVIPE